MTTETLTTAVTTAVTSPEYTGIWIQFLGAFAVMIGTALTYFFKKVADRIIEKMNATDTEKEAIAAIMAGVAVAQDTLVDEAKKVSADGKLTKEEIEEAKKIAYDYALEIATGPVKDLLLTWGKTRVDSVVKNLLAKLKA